MRTSWIFIACTIVPLFAVGAADLRVTVLDIPADADDIAWTAGKDEKTIGDRLPTDGSTFVRLPAISLPGGEDWALTLITGDAEQTVLLRIDPTVSDMFLFVSMAQGVLDEAYLELKVSDIAPPQGSLKVKVFRIGDEGSSAHLWNELTADAERSTVTVRSGRLPQGRYALMIGHDADGDAEVAPSEPRVPRAREGAGSPAPTEESTAIFDLAGQRTVDVSMKYGFFRTASLVLKVKGFRNDDGKVQVTLFNSARGFPNKPKLAFATADAPVRDGTATVTFEEIPWGTWACGLFHDENANAEMDTNFFGVPREGYGASRDARGRLGPPSFEDAAFEIEQDRVELVVNMVY